jgi:hypothetical protein
MDLLVFMSKCNLFLCICMSVLWGCLVAHCQCPTELRQLKKLPHHLISNRQIALQVLFSIWSGRVVQSCCNSKLQSHRVYTVKVHRRWNWQNKIPQAPKQCYRWKLQKIHFLDWVTQVCHLHKIDGGSGRILAFQNSLLGCNELLYLRCVDLDLTHYLQISSSFHFLDRFRSREENFFLPFRSVFQGLYFLYFFRSIPNLS